MLMVILIAWAAMSQQQHVQERQDSREDLGAAEILPRGLTPRFFLGTPQLARRDGPPCDTGNHRCIDIDQDRICCPNDHYCYIRPDGSPRCCAIGSNCDSNCAATAYQCVRPVTTGTVSTITSACCSRSCPSTSYFQCEAEFGGECCRHGATCASGGICRMTTGTSTASAVVTAIDRGCTAATQRACPDEEGCCDEWMHCTSVDGTAACAPGNTDTGYTFSPEPGSNGDDDGGGGGGLSAGAKAGIGVGAAVAACSLIGFILWFCLFRRRKGSKKGNTDSQNQATSNGGAVGGGGGGLGLSLGRELRGGGNTNRSQYQPQHPTTMSDRSPGQAVSEVTSDISRPTHLRGLAQDYFGPEAVTGPYTETETDHARSPSNLTRGVPVRAQSPGDIAAPVEIDSRVAGDAGGEEGMSPTWGYGVPGSPSSPVEVEARGNYEMDKFEASSPGTRGQQQRNLFRGDGGYYDVTPSPPGYDPGISPRREDGRRKGSP